MSARENKDSVNVSLGCSLVTQRKFLFPREKNPAHKQYLGSGLCTEGGPREPGGWCVEGLPLECLSSVQGL